MSFKILIVEDDIPILMLFQSIIEQQGYQVVAHTNGEEAINYLKESTPDLALLDLTLQGKTTGVDIIDYIDASPHLNSTAIIVISANPQMSPKVYSSRVARVITKPIRPSAIQAAVQAFLTPSQ